MYAIQGPTDQHAFVELHVLDEGGVAGEDGVRGEGGREGGRGVVGEGDVPEFDQVVVGGCCESTWERVREG